VGLPNSDSIYIYLLAYVATVAVWNQGNRERRVKKLCGAEFENEEKGVCEKDGMMGRLVI
jgi:hypothetical protein